MAAQYTENETFIRKDYTREGLPGDEYENSIFGHFDFSRSSLNEIRFLNCEIKSCNLALSSLSGTSFQDVRFSTAN